MTPPEAQPAKREHAKALASGKARLEELKRDLAEGGTAFSTLSPGATLLAGSQGVSPLGVVMGSSVYQISLRCRLLTLLGLSRPTGEMQAFVQAHMDLRRHAIERLKSEAAMLGADGVIDVSIDFQTIAAGPVEYKAIGTAVRVANRPADGRKAPFTCDLNAQDFCKLVQSGGWPIDVVYGISVQWVRASWKSWIAQWSLKNREIEQMSQAIYDARRDAMARMRQQAGRLGASHVVGSDVWYEVIPIPRFNENIKDLVVVYFARGTAVDTRRAAPQASGAKPLMMLDLATGDVSALNG